MELLYRAFWKNNREHLVVHSAWKERCPEASVCVVSQVTAKGLAGRPECLERINLEAWLQKYLGKRYMDGDLRMRPE